MTTKILAVDECAIAPKEYTFTKERDGAVAQRDILVKDFDLHFSTSHEENVTEVAILRLNKQSLLQLKNAIDMAL